MPKMRVQVRSLYRSRQGFTMIELCICLALITALVAILLPAIQQARGAARRAVCLSRFRQIGLAMTNYVDVHNRWPPNATTPWPVAVAPAADRAELYARYDHLQTAFSSAINSLLGEEAFPLLTCPSDEQYRISPWNWVASNIVTNDTLHGATPAVCTDGLSQTMLATEILAAHGHGWITGPEFRFEFPDSAHSNSITLLRADGSAAAIHPDISRDLFRALITPNGSEIISEN